MADWEAEVGDDNDGGAVRNSLNSSVVSSRRRDEPGVASGSTSAALSTSVMDSLRVRGLSWHHAVRWSLSSWYGGAPVTMTKRRYQIYKFIDDRDLQRHKLQQGRTNRSDVQRGNWIQSSRPRRSEV